MPRQINLYNPAFEAQRAVLSFKGAVAGWVLIAILVTAVAAYETMAVRSAQQQTQQLSQHIAAAQADVQRLGASVSARRHDPRVGEELARLESEVRDRQETMEILRAGGLGDTRGFSDYLKAFARQSFDGMWLTGLSIATAGKNMSVEGRALEAAYVPGYLKRLNGESAMTGHPFSELIIQEPARDPAAKHSERPTYVEFKLSTKPNSATESTADKQ